MDGKSPYNNRINDIPKKVGKVYAYSGKSHLPFIALALGLLSVIAALSIGFTSYDRTVTLTEQKHLQFYLNIARMLAMEAELQTEYSDGQLLELIYRHWEGLDNFPDDEYVCIVDKDSKLLLHSMYPGTVGNYAGDNLIAGCEAIEACDLKTLVKKQAEYTGGYTSSAGENQVAAFVPIKDRGWILGVHRPRSAILKEVRAVINPLFNGLLFVCGVLIPVSMALLYGAFHVTQIKRRAVEHEREELLKSINANNAELQSIVYVSSHDLKSPLVNIAGFSGFLAESCDRLKHLIKIESPDQSHKQEIRTLVEEHIPESIGFINAGTNQMQMLTDGLLKISRVGTVEVECKKVDMNKLFADLAEMVSFQVEDAGATLQIEDVPDCVCDEGQLKQLFGNLIDNAIKYLCPDKKGLIRITGRRVGNRSVYCVEDNGIGIDEMHKDRIFEIYHRLDPRGVKPGEGLGLSIVRRILNRHNGEIWVKSKPGDGSRFYVSLSC